MPNRFRCELCEEWIEHPETENLMEAIGFGADHFRVIHPDYYEEMQQWPDGGPVVVDLTLMPASFTGSEPK